MKKLLTILSICLALPSAAQFTDGISGYLQCPSAEMYPDGTFMITSNWLNKESLSPTGWGYSTLNYGINLTLWSRVEIAYVCTIFDGKRKENPTERQKIMLNQDRHYVMKFLALREGEIWKWTPSIAVGISDPITSIDGEYKFIIKKGNDYFNRMFAVATKHINTGIGQFGISAGYQYSLRYDRPINGPCGAVTWNPVWLNHPDWVFCGFRLIAEYDSRTFNAGAVASIWGDRFDFMFEWQNFKWYNVGLRFKIILK